ncbi:hypothetical protein EGW08_004645 [Elysia chlorotica]|uniref:Uncharacterized protein n=1 Tax=Elysia chlorotica TaxID=188477 RepID=A0A433U1C0_ELYCH|nr:hypothetical protein EGW08_004645 [Elysia chlorotica]
MALFARMEEENRRAQERDKVARRKISPSRLSITSGGTPSPLLSPSGQENQSFLSPSTDSLQRSRRSKSIPQENASEARTSRPLSDSMTQAVNPPDAAEDGRLRSHSGPDGAEVAADCTQTQSQETHSAPSQKDSVKVSSDFSQSKFSGRTSATSDKDKISADSTNNTAEEVELRPTSVLPHSSRLEHSTRPNVRAQYQAKSAHSPGLSSSPGPGSASSSPHSRSKQASRHSAPPSPHPPVSASVAGAEVVTLRANRTSKADSSNNGTSSNGPSETAKKRLSREEIEFALERADNYLANLEAVPDPAPVKKPEHHHHRSSESSSSAARRKFLYGDAAAAASSSPSPPSSSSSSPSKRRSVGHEEPTREEVVAADVMVAHKAGPPQQASAPPDPKRTGTTTTTSTSSTANAFDQLNSLLTDMADDDTKTTAGLGGIETEGEERLPPSYIEATSNSSILMSQLVSQGEDQEPPSPTQPGEVNLRPIPVPRRAAPPAPSQPPASRVTPPPPPAPEPGSGEVVQNLRTQGSRHGLVLDKDTADDLVLPEEHIAHHNQDG